MVSSASALLTSAAGTRIADGRRLIGPALKSGVDRHHDRARHQRDAKVVRRAAEPLAEADGEALLLAHASCIRRARSVGVSRTMRRNERV